MEIKKFFYAFLIGRWFRSGIHSLQRRNDDRRNADIIHRISRIIILASEN